MSLPDFTQDSTLGAFDKYLVDKSYVDGHAPSQADVAVFEVIKSPNADKYPHVARWYTHIASWEAEHPSLQGDKKQAANILSNIANAGAQSSAAAADDDDDIDLFGSDDEVDEEAERIKAERVAEYEKKKAAKGPRAAAKSVVTFEVKPWDDETDMKALEESVRSIEMDGLVWGASKLVAVGYGVSKLQITIVVEDEKVSLDDLQERVAEFEELVQSSDIAAMQKL
ncbi:putative EFB1-translation elongation factor eEF1beta [Tilletiaria anomala UBC 951]|uniref:Putative EFB1-translation elongation factor eEF1beta n=1 Tax=Tilletiaria anomala (strain ATCC 24038 / CBS 436.72 / UBC 951) TaxID=1037660 RepID=A0A066VDS3_TILAU|nr:putative EFB1-translation elongation factor eEF1beta [Tilletiaria anomala UBC 951]KDN38448.1 putative EFB1-translation elongation factor eEF1beta [Tilletiaria anomala UBC 951]